LIILKYLITTRLTSEKVLKKITRRFIKIRADIKKSIMKPQRLFSSLSSEKSEKSIVKKNIQLENTTFIISSRLSKNVYKG